MKKCLKKAFFLTSLYSIQEELGRLCVESIATLCETRPQLRELVDASVQSPEEHHPQIERIRGVLGRTMAETGEVTELLALCI
jgi:hypothetical protein